MFTFNNKALVTIIVLSSSQPLNAETLKDPTTRNEDISNTTVDVTVTTRSDGYYNYEYVVSNPLTNLGEISSFHIDISCNLDLPDFLGLGELDNYSNDFGDGMHVPIHAESDTGLPPAITADNKVNFAILRSPGETKQGIRIISAQPPSDRQYTLYPVMSSEGWDYSAYPEDMEPDENGQFPFPTTADFIVHGVISAPACSTGDGGDNPDCHEGKGKALGHTKGKGHEISQGKHLGHEHDCQ